MAKLTHAVDGAKIKSRRGELLLTQAEVAAATGLTETSIRTYERGGASVHAATLRRLATTLSCSPDDIRPSDIRPSDEEVASL